MGNILRYYLHAADLWGRDGKSQKQKAKRSEGSKSGQWENLNHGGVVTKSELILQRVLELGWPLRVILSWAGGWGLCTMTLTRCQGKAHPPGEGRGSILGPGNFPHLKVICLSLQLALVLKEESRVVCTSPLKS